MKPAIGITKKKLANGKHKDLFDSNLYGLNRVSTILRRLSNCHNCQIKKWCPKFKTMTDRQKTVGCQDLREIWKFELRKYSQPIDYVIIDELARIDTLMRAQELEDGEKGVPLSQSMMRLKHLKAHYVDIILKHYKPKEVKVEHDIIFGTGKIKIDPTAYEEEGLDVIKDDFEENGVHTNNSTNEG